MAFCSQALALVPLNAQQSYCSHQPEDPVLQLQVRFNNATEFWHSFWFIKFQQPFSSHQLPHGSDFQTHESDAWQLVCVV